MAELTERQKRFCDYYLECGNATEAARRAGYKAKTARVQASRLLAKANISEYLRTFSEDKERIATAEEVLETFTRILRREEVEYQVVTLKTVKTYWENGKKCVDEKETAERVAIPARLSDVNRAAEALAKRYGLFNAQPDTADMTLLKELLKLETKGHTPDDLE